MRASLHPDLLPPLARLMKKCAEHTQLWVTSHAASIVGVLTDAGDCNHLELDKEFGETFALNFDRLDLPPWRWPAR